MRSNTSLKRSGCSAGCCTSNRIAPVIG